MIIAKRVFFIFQENVQQKTSYINTNIYKITDRTKIPARQKKKMCVQQWPKRTCLSARRTNTWIILKKNSQICINLPPVDDVFGALIYINLLPGFC